MIAGPAIVVSGENPSSSCELVEVVHEITSKY